MLSKVIRRDAPDAGVVAPWHIDGQSPQAEPPRAGSAAAGPQKSAPLPEAVEKIARLERRVTELQAEMEKRVRDAQQSARREGEAAGRQQAAAEVQAALKRMAGAIDEMAGVRDRLRRESEADLVRLAVAIAQRILHRQLTVDPDAITGIIKAGFEKLKRQEICRVRVHPSHHATLSAMLPAAGGPPLELLADPSLQPGGVIFETSRGDLEASVDTQLREIERGLTDCLQSQHE